MTLGQKGLRERTVRGPSVRARRPVKLEILPPLPRAVCLFTNDEKAVRVTYRVRIDRININDLIRLRDLIKSRHFLGRMKRKTQRELFITVNVNQYL